MLLELAVESILRILSLFSFPAINGAYVVFYMEPSDLDRHDLYTCYTTIVQGNELIALLGSFKLLNVVL